LAAAANLTAYDHSALADTGPCQSMEFERAAYTICEIDLHKHTVRLYWNRSDGTPYAYLSALPRSLEGGTGRMLFATNAGMFDSNLKPVGLYVEQGRELVFDAFAVARYAAEQLVLWGESLGSALAIALAADNRVGSLVLEAPFTSAVDVGAQHYWFVPVRLLMRDQFRSDLWIGKVRAPVLVVHGENDTVVPISLGERLYGLARMPRHFVRVAGAGHNDLGVHAVAAAKRFIAEQPAV
jgi:fermentation-respiration switch protein FrsA (DUF1100 family)